MTPEDKAPDMPDVIYAQRKGYRNQWREREHGLRGDGKPATKYVRADTLPAQPSDNEALSPDQGAVEDVRFIRKELGRTWINQRQREVTEDIHARLHRIEQALTRPPLDLGQIVHTVYRSDDQTNHVFSTAEKAQTYANTLTCPCVISEYAVDCPERFYGEEQ